MDDVAYIRRCVELALKAGKSTRSNPMVGAVLVFNNTIIGEGWHQRYGGPHAEVMAIESVPRDKKHLIPNSILYVSLEPCCVHSKTPPCTDLIIRSGIKKVVIGSTDPDERMRGKGIKILSEAQIDVVEGVLQETCDKLIRKFKSNLRRKPYVILKWATSFDGYMGHQTQRLIISGAEAAILVHKWRSENDAILIGKNTAIEDNPSLTTRHHPGDSPIRVILDAKLEVPSHSILLNDGLPSILVNEVKESQEGPVKYLLVRNVKNLEEVLSSLFEAGICSVLVEGGASILQAFIKSGLWDEARVIRTPALLGNMYDTKDLVKAPDIHGKLVNEMEVGNGERFMFLDRD